MPFPSLCSKVTPSWGIDGSSPRMGWVWFCWNQTTGGKVLHPAQGDARFPDRGAPGKAQLSSLQSQRQSEHPKIISMESPWWDLQHRDAPSPGRHQEQGSSAKAGQAAPGARGQLRSQPGDVQGDQALGCSSAEGYQLSSSVPACVNGPAPAAGGSPQLHLSPSARQRNQGGAHPTSTASLLKVWVGLVLLNPLICKEENEPMILGVMSSRKSQISHGQEAAPNARGFPCTSQTPMETNTTGLCLTAQSLRPLSCS